MAYELAFPEVPRLISRGGPSTLQDHASFCSEFVRHSLLETSGLLMGSAYLPSGKFGRPVGIGMFEASNKDSVLITVTIAVLLLVSTI